MLRMDTYDGMDSEIDRDDLAYIITPRLTEQVCYAFSDVDASGANGDRVRPASHETASGVAGILAGGLPDLSQWRFVAAVKWHGIDAYKWFYAHKDQHKLSTYVFILTPAGTPLHLHMLGSEITVGAHFDLYEANFTSFEAIDADDLSPFQPPENCNDAADVLRERPISLWHASLHLPEPDWLLHPGHLYHPTCLERPHQVKKVSRSAYDEFAEAHGRQHKSFAEYWGRAALFHQNHLHVSRHNARKDRTHTLALNHFADWSDVEFKRLLGWRRSPSVAAELEALQRGETLAASATASEFVKRRSLYRPTKEGLQGLPTHVDWRGSGAVGPVKDQAVCGSCWAFSASQVMQSAWFMATGDSVNLSEQQLMDCSWEYGSNEACNGGDPDLAVQYVIDHGGAVSEHNLPYLGEDGYCAVNSTRSSEVRAKMQKLVYVERYNEKAAMRALADHGPLSIGINANPYALRFYTSGVLHLDSCPGKPDDLDHAVLLVGYGEEDGEPYWLVKNEWSYFWGDHGFFKIHRKQDCGVTTEAFFVVADDASMYGAVEVA